MTDYRVLIGSFRNREMSPALCAYCNYFTEIGQVPGLRFESAGVHLGEIKKLTNIRQTGISKRVGFLLEQDGLYIRDHQVRYAGDLVRENFQLVLSTDNFVKRDLTRMKFKNVKLAKRFAGEFEDDIFDPYLLMRVVGFKPDDRIIDADYIEMVREIKEIARGIVKRLEGVV
jgi:hypothetical protein